MLVLVLFMLLFLSYTNNIYGKSIHYDEICGGFDGRRLYLELGEHGTLLATKVNGSKNDENLLDNYKHCSLEVVTCPSCIISIQFSFLNITHGCQISPRNDKCECDHVWIYESTYEDVSGKRFCGNFAISNNNSLAFKSNTRSTSINFIYSQSYERAFALKYFSERNRHFINSYLDKDSTKDTRNKYLSSPFFPKHYPKDLSVEYILNCRTTQICKIKLIFSDFQISRSSLIEFFDWNGQRMFVTTGFLFRPPILMSSGPTMVIRFYANGGTNIGFKLMYTYVLGDQTNITTKTNTDCGGLVDNLGGAITMMEMTGDEEKMYNCFWLIKPPPGYMHIKTHLYAKVTKFQDFVGKAVLLVKEGMTSEGFLLANLTYPSDLRITEHIVAINEGIYMSLTGTFSSNSKLEVVYSAFSYKDCLVASDFSCRNGRCVSTTLQCDGFDNCGDFSDEPEVCATEHKNKLYSHVPNFYFPKSDRDFDLKTATIVFIISSLALMCLIVSLIILLYRINMKGTNNNNNNRNHLQSHLQSINDLLEENSRVEEVEIIISDDPPIYEAPPDYADIIKGNDIRTFKKQTPSKKIIKPNTENRLVPISNNDLDIVALSIARDATSLLSRSSDNISELPPNPLPVENGVDSSASSVQSENVLLDDPVTDEDPVQSEARIKKVAIWKEKYMKFEFSTIDFHSIDKIGGFSSLRLSNKRHCLSDSSLSSINFLEDGVNKLIKIVRSVSSEKIN